MITNKEWRFNVIENNISIFVKNVLTSIFIVFIVLFTLPFGARAAGVPEIRYQSSGKIFGLAHDGLHIGRGYISYDEEHSGFQVWSDSASLTGKSGVYELTGQQNIKNKLRVRFTGDDGWHPDPNGKGMVINTVKNNVNFDVVVDGEQKLKADYYLLDFKCVALLP